MADDRHQNDDSDDTQKSSDHDDDEHSNDRDEDGGEGDKSNGGKGDDEKGGDKKGGDDKKDDDEDKTPIYKKPLFWVILIAVVLVLGIGGFLYWSHARQFESTDDAFVDAHIVRLAPQVSGTLVQVASVDNQHVEPGTLLAVIQQTGPQASVAEANANVIQAVAEAQQARAQVASAVADRARAAEAARNPIANAIKAAQDLGRYQRLAALDRSAVAGQQLDQARAQARAAAGDAAAARRQVNTANAQVVVAERQVKAADAVVTARKAALRSSQVTLGNSELRAPIAGQVVNRSVNLGSYVGPGTQLMAIVPDTMWITANFKETQLALMRMGQPVSIKVDAFPQVEFQGHVDSIQRGAGQAFALLPAQNATGNYVKVVQRVPVRITFDLQHGPDPRKYSIGPGMSVVPTVKVR